VKISLKNDNHVLSAFFRRHMFFVFIMLVPALLLSQNVTPLDTNDKEQESVVIQKDAGPTKEETLTKSPWTALWRSFLLPGLGQIYVESYWKAPIFMVATGTCIYFIVWNNSQYQQYQQEYDDLKASDPGNTSDLDKLSSQKEFYRDNRDKSYFFLGITYIVAAVDAYVGAYLFDFEIDDDLSLRLAPYYSNHPGIYASFKFK